MNKNEIIFAAILVLAYITASISLNITPATHLLAITIVAGALVLIWIYKLQKDKKNDAIWKIAAISCIISTIMHLIITVSYPEMTFPLVLAALDVFFVIFLVILVIFRKK